VRSASRLYLLLLLCITAACDTEDRPSLHGYLYFAAGNYIGSFDLSDSSSAAVVNLGDVSIDHLGPFQNDLLITLREYSNGREVSRILRFNVRRSETFTLFPGLDAEFLPADSVIIYDDGLNLLATHRANSYNDETLIDAHGRNARPSVVVLSDAEILYNQLVEDEVLIQRYDSITNTSSPLPALSRLCSLNAAVWLPDRQRLLCRVRRDESGLGNYQLVSLDGQQVSPVGLPADRKFRALGYLHDQGKIVLSEVSRSWGGGQPRNAVWIYDLHAKDVWRIARDQYLGDAVVYRP